MSNLWLSSEEVFHWMMVNGRSVWEGGGVTWSFVDFGERVDEKEDNIFDFIDNQMLSRLEFSEIITMLRGVTYPVMFLERLPYTWSYILFGTTSGPPGMCGIILFFIEDLKGRKNSRGSLVEVLLLFFCWLPGVELGIAWFLLFVGWCYRSLFVGLFYFFYFGLSLLRRICLWQHRES